MQEDLQCSRMQLARTTLYCFAFLTLTSSAARVERRVSSAVLAALDFEKLSAEKRLSAEQLIFGNAMLQV